VPDGGYDDAEDEQASWCHHLSQQEGPADQEAEPGAQPTGVVGIQSACRGEVLRQLTLGVAVQDRACVHGHIAITVTLPPSRTRGRNPTVSRRGTTLASPRSRRLMRHPDSAAALKCPPR
jgi:hypothetical protein